jgi:hypothetical protein
MREKYLVCISEVVACVRYDLRNGETIVGGNARFRETYERIIVGYFADRVPRIRFVQKNKVRYTFTLNKSRFDAGIKSMREQNFTVERVRSHGRMMR